MHHQTEPHQGQAPSSVEERSVDVVRMLAMDMVSTAGSGHYGFPLGATAVVHTLYARHLRFDPERPDWLNRDRFVLSAGHGSAMLYALLHVAGYDLTTDDLRAFRTYGSRTPGHPERGDTPGVEVTTGPLGQGFANAVGLAIAEEHLRATLGPEHVDHKTWVLASDGDLMEGMSYEAAALAGKLRLGNLIAIYDDNDIVIDSRASEVVDADGICGMFEALDWQVIGPVDAHDVEALDAAMAAAATNSETPTLIRAQSRIGAHSPLEDDRRSHSGAPSAEDLEQTRTRLGVADLAPFEVPAEVTQFWREVSARHDSSSDEQLTNQLSQRVDDGARAALEMLAGLPVDGPEQATRAASGVAMAAVERHPLFIGGSADLAEATFAELPDGGTFGPDDRAGRNIRFGVREHGMAAISSGIAMHSVLRSFSSTFLMFATYNANAIRMAALQGSPTVFVFSHDSVLIGEDGPTHQPVEVLPFLRAIPDLRVWRPADDAETFEAWRDAISCTDGPVVIILGRQNVPQLDRSEAEGSASDGIYAVRSVSDPELVLVATGSEVHLATLAAEEFPDRRITVVSAPRLDSGTCSDLASGSLALPGLAPDGPPRVLVEASHPMSWWALRRPGDAVISVERFGASAPATVMAEEYGLTVGNVVTTIRGLLN